MAGGIVEFTPEAEDELDAVFRWIASDTGLNAARAFSRRVDRAVRNLADFPEMARVRDEIPGTPRSHSVHPWIIFYEPLSEPRGIRVLRVIDGRRDIPEVMGGNDQ